MFTPEQLMEAANTVKDIIVTVHHHKFNLHFKETVLRNVGWDPKEYNIERLHMSGYVFRMTLVHDDGRQKDVYEDVSAVFEWFLYIGNNLTDFE